jgi:hypothetical protein
MVGLQVVQAHLQLGPYAVWLQVVVPAALLVAQGITFGKDQDVVAPTLKGLAYKLLGAPLAIKGRGVNPVHA